MGTSSSFGGPLNRTPLVPSWLIDDLDGDLTAGNQEEGFEEAVEQETDKEAKGVPGPAVEPSRFTVARQNFSKFASSGGGDRASLGRAISHYVSSTAGGSRTAAVRMGASRRAGVRLLGFLSDTVTKGAREALRSLDLEHLAGKPIEEVFIGLADFVCPDGGSVDEGIAREAFIETIVDLTVAGISDLDSLTPEHMQTVFELYVTNTIEARICNDIAARILTLPQDARESTAVVVQLHDFIRRGVADALNMASSSMQSLTAERVLFFVNKVYEQVFEILKILGDAEANQE